MASDALVIGGGAFGLNCALALALSGRQVALLDRAGPEGVMAGGGMGHAASMGLVGALGAHQPAPPSPLKTLQLEALVSLPAHAARLAQIGGRDAGWRARGRLSPLADQRARDRAEAQAAEAGPLWRAALEAMDPALRAPPPAGAPDFPWRGAGGPAMRLLAAPPDAGWMAPPECGVLADDLAAAIPPRSYLGALRAACAAAGVDLRFDAPVAGVEDGAATLTDGTRLRAPLIVIAAGAESFGLLPPDARAAAPAEKGQAAFFDIAPPPGAALLHAAGLWIAPHDRGIAVGSTAEKSWTAPGPDALLDEVLERAAAICPPLRGRAPAERWAGLRPGAPGRGPMLGPVPGAPGLWLATGGRKIGVALSHRVAGLLVAMLDHGPDAATAWLPPDARMG